ncbi:MAG: Ig-like domain-containing protein [Vicinamibacterales bacterium]|jgi:hypothetical protein
MKANPIARQLKCAAWSVVAASLAMAACSPGASPTSPSAAAPVAVASALEPPVAAAPLVPTPTVPAPGLAAGAITSIAVEPARVRGGESAVGTVTLAAAAPAGGMTVTLTSSDRDVRPPAAITIAAGQTVGMFNIPTSEPHADTDVRLTATTTDDSATTGIVLVLPAPGAHTDNYSMTTGSTLVVAAPGILDNDARRRGHDLTAVLRLPPLGGTLSLNNAGGFTYQPNAGYVGTDRFTYWAVDGTTRSNEAHVWITVAAAIIATTPTPAPTGSSTPAPTGSSTSAPTGSQTFSYTGAAQTFVVPEGVTQITVEAYGAQGGTGLTSGLAGGTAGLGGFIRATLAVTAGASYQVNVGGQGANGASGVAGGGAGGGASDLRTGGTSTANRVLVAGGGGGGGLGFTGNGAGGAGGAGGALTGAAGGGTTSGAGGGTGGTQAAGGSGGGGGAVGVAGALAQGGNGAGASGNTVGGFNGGGNGRAPGAGGGGYHGGGGGGQANSGGGGGGGSSFAIATATNVTHQQGGRSGNGEVRITW